MYHFGQNRTRTKKRRQDWRRDLPVTCGIINYRNKGLQEKAYYTLGNIAISPLISRGSPTVPKICYFRTSNELKLTLLP